MHPLSSDPAIPMDFEAFLTNIWFTLGIYFSSFGQDSRLDYHEYYGCEPLRQYQVNTKIGPLSLLYQGFRSWQFFHAFFKPILQKKLSAWDDESRSMWSNIKCRFLAIRALATDTVITEAIKPPLLWRSHKNFRIIWSKLPNKKQTLSW